MEGRFTQNAGLVFSRARAHAVAGVSQFLKANQAGHHGVPIRLPERTVEKVPVTTAR